MTVHIRRAKPDECELLSDFAVSSKRAWGYDDDFLIATRSDLVVTVDDIQKDDCFVAEQNGDVVGFYLIARDSLERFFVAPDLLRNGIGRALFEHATDITRSQVLRIVSDPNAAAFYEHMGATRSGEEESLFIPGRVLPVFEFRTLG